MLIDELVPPFMKKIIRKTLFRTRVYNDFNSTMQVLQNFAGYENDILIDIIFQKTKIFIEEIKKHPYYPLGTHHLFLLSVIGLIKKSRVKVLDFGGAFGTHYFIVKTFFPQLELDWTVIELPQVVEKGRQLDEPALKFLDIQENFDKTIGDFDLILTAGTLQHMPDPEKTLNYLCKHNAPFLVLLRLGVNLSSKDIWVIHKAQFKDCGPGALPANFPNGTAIFPFCMMSEHKLKHSLVNYELKLSSVDLSGTILVPGYEVEGFNRLYQLS